MMRTPDGAALPPDTRADVRRGKLQLAWRLLLFQKENALAQWYWARTADARGGTRKTMMPMPMRAS